MLVYFYHQQGKYGGPAFKVTKLKLNNTPEKDVDMKLNPFLNNNGNGKNLLGLFCEENKDNKTLQLDMGQRKNHAQIAGFVGWHYQGVIRNSQHKEM